VLSQIARHDTGTPLGFLKAAIEITLSDPDVGPALKRFLADLSA
jgi:UTP-glucose-1-phosphate uridylyltransferase